LTPGFQNDPEQIRVSLQLAESEMTLWEHKVAAYKERQTKERGFIALLARKVLDKDGTTSQVTNDYLRTHKGHSDAEVNIMELQIAKLKGQAAVLKAALENLAAGPGPTIKDVPPLITPGGRILAPGR
jgi:hypothetical protein